MTLLDLEPGRTFQGPGALHMYSTTRILAISPTGSFPFFTVPGLMQDGEQSDKFSNSIFGLTSSNQEPQ